MSRRTTRATTQNRAPAKIKLSTYRSNDFRARLDYLERTGSKRPSAARAAERKSW